MKNCTEADRLSTMILGEISEQDDTDPTEVSPKLYTTIDTDALESLFFGSSNGPVTVEFSHAGYLVTIHGDEIVRVNVE